MNDIKEPTQFDLNSIFIAALSQAITQATAPLVTRIAALEARLETITTASEERIMEIAEEVAERHISEHNDEYNHDEYDRLEYRLDEKVTEMIEEYDFDEKIREVLRGVSVTLDI